MDNSAQEKEFQRRMMERGADLYRCPNNGRIIETMKHDDKVLCNCGRTSPALAKRGFQDAPGTHMKSFLPSATFEEWWEQRLKDEEKRNKKN